MELTASDGVQTGVLVRTSHPWGSPPDFISVRIQVDQDEVHVRPWGESFFGLKPGMHTVMCCYRWTFRKASSASMTIEVTEGRTVILDYRSGLTTFGGKLTYGNATPILTKPVPRLGPVLTGGLAVLAAFGLLTRDTPRTTGDVLAAIAVGIFGLLLIAAILWLKRSLSSRESVVAAQVLVTALVVATDLLTQHPTLSATWWIEGAVLFLGPLLITEHELRTSTPAPLQGADN